MICLRNKVKNCPSMVITPEWEEYPACMAGKECNYHPDSFSVFVAKRETEILGTAGESIGRSMGGWEERKPE